LIGSVDVVQDHGGDADNQLASDDDFTSVRL